MLNRAAEPGRKGAAVPGAANLGNPTTPSNIEFDNNSSASRTLNYTLPAGTNRLLCVLISHEQDGTSVNSATYDGNAMTVHTKSESGVNEINWATYQVPDGDSGSKAIVVNASPSGYGPTISAMCVTGYEGDGVSVLNNDSGGLNEESISVDVSAAGPNDMLIMGICHNGTAHAAPSWGSGQTGIIDRLEGAQYGNSTSASYEKGEQTSMTYEDSGYFARLCATVLRIHAE